MRNEQLGLVSFDPGEGALERLEFDPADLILISQSNNFAVVCMMISLLSWNIRN